MLVRILDSNDHPLWINAHQVRWLRPLGPGRTALQVADERVEVKAEAAELANQLQDALAGRKYVDFWSA